MCVLNLAPALHSRQRGTYASFRFSCSDKKGTCRDRFLLIRQLTHTGSEWIEPPIKVIKCVFFNQRPNQQTHLWACGCMQIAAPRLRRSTPERVQVQFTSCTTDLIRIVEAKTLRDTRGSCGGQKPRVAVTEWITPPVFRCMSLNMCSTSAPAVGRCGCESVEGLWGGPTHRNAFQLYF